MGPTVNHSSYTVDPLKQEVANSTNEQVAVNHSSYTVDPLKLRVSDKVWGVEVS